MTVCQQLLVLGVICAALTPAVNVMSLDLVPHAPNQRAGASTTSPGDVSASMAAYAQAAQMVSAVPDEPVDATVKEYPLTAPTGARVRPGSLEATSQRTESGDTELVSEPQPVTGYGAVGVTWEHGAEVPDDEIAIQVRTKDADGWSEWLPMIYHDEHAPEEGSKEALRARPGTDELLVGEVDEVQVKIASQQAAPADLKLAVIDPGVAESTSHEKAAIDTASLPGEDTAQADGVATLDSSEGDLELAAAAFTPKPVIYSREQWGADERLRDPGSLHYYEVHAGFVHHTVNANNYKAKDVPAILRGIYAYHTKSRGWSDVGYNYLVDRFGRIWEGRYGGVDRPVVGAHTLGFNDDAFAMSAIGNFEEAMPSQAMIQAYGALFGWKLSLHGVKAGSMQQYVTSKNFRAINGHRDAGSTACPGKYLYAKLPEIRKLAAQTQVGFGGRQLESNVTSTPEPDLIVRRASDGKGFVIPIKPIGAPDNAKKRKNTSAYKLGKPVPMAVNLTGVNKILNVGDWDRDGFTDLVTRRAKDGVLFLRLGLGNGMYGPFRKIADGFKSVGLLAAVGDMTGDGWPDLMGQPRGGSMRIYPGTGLDGLGESFVAFSKVAGQQQFGIGLWGPDGAPDSLIRRGPKLEVYAGNGPGGLIGGRDLDVNLRPFDWVVGISDVELVGHPDLVLRSKGNGQLWLVQANAEGFAAPELLGSGMEVYDMVG
ncbi:MAG: N-acetylmuramoyl-L-alanine amidase [Nocardioides sp.]